MFTPMFNIPISSAGLEETLKDIVKSIIDEETAVTHILNLEKEIIQKAKSSARNVDEFVSVNESVNSVINNLIKLQMMMQIKLKYIEELLENIEYFDGNDELEE